MPRAWGAVGGSLSPLGNLKDSPRVPFGLATEAADSFRADSELRQEGDADLVP